MISSEMEELIGVSDRIIVLCEGHLMGELQKSEFSQSEILRLASGL
jgi:ABC-type sugar transport system ATPase subunit